jgi:hypothetical protein
LPQGRRLVDVSASDTSGFGPQVQGVVAISADGSHVYFVANGVLTGAANGQGEKATPGHCHEEVDSCNLYVYDTGTHRTSFIAPVPGSGSAIWRQAGLFFANVTPEGRFLVFDSRGDLTGDDTRSDGDMQVFRYDAESKQLLRVSIGQDGYDDDGNAGGGEASIVPPSTAFSQEQAGPSRGDPTMSNNGDYVFFQSPIGLTPSALNDIPITTLKGGSSEYAENVYEWEAGGSEVDGKVVCVEASGCVHLISDGRDTNIDPNGPCKDGRHFYRDRLSAEGFFSAVCLLGTDAEGKNVFFTSADQLVPADTDTQVDIYDARVCEPEAGNPCIAPAASPPEPCQGEQCHGIPEATPSLIAPGSASFNGEGNVAPTPAKPAVKPKALTRAQKLAAALKACHKKKGKKRTQCEKQAHRTYGAAKKTSIGRKNRRAGR